MNSGELYDTFRSDVVDTAKPYLWSDVEVYRYMDAAYKMFVRLTGGIKDFTSEVCEIAVSTGERVADYHPSILRFLTATRASDGTIVKIVNLNDEVSTRGSDYGIASSLLTDTRPGDVHSMLIGRQRGKVEFVGTPVVDDTIRLTVHRLPLVSVSDGSHPLDEVDSDHHTYLLDWMKHLAYRKQDAETFDKAKSEQCGQDFERYCFSVKAQHEREAYRVGAVAYGGI